MYSELELNKYENGFELFRTNPTFNKCIRTGLTSYEIVEILIKENIRLYELMKNYISATPSYRPLSKKELEKIFNRQ